MEADVAVAEREPGLAAEPPASLERVRRLVADAPAALLVEEPGERVEDGVEVGGDVQAEDLDVVADVDDRRHLLRPGRAGEGVHEARAAETAAENGVRARLYAHRVLAIVPVKGLDGAKTRLAPRLSAAERARLVVEMLDRVLAACAEAEAIERTLLVTPDPGLARDGVDVLVDAGTGHADALALASPTRGPRTALSSSWATARSSRPRRWTPGARPGRSRSPPPGTAASTPSRSRR